MEKGKLSNTKNDVESLCSQDSLRDKLKEIENKYEELKHNFMNFLSAILKH